MEKNTVYDRYRSDTNVLAAIGGDLERQVPEATVTLPRDLAELAMASWEWDAEGEPGPESNAEARIRHNSGDLALIGLAITERGVWDGDRVSVTLDIGLLGRAVSVAAEVANDDY
jgi:hypothetical protein